MCSAFAEAWKTELWSASCGFHYGLNVFSFFLSPYFKSKNKYFKCFGIIH